MKQLIIILIAVLTFTSCMKEDLDGCPNYIRFTFLHQESTRGYDETIGNDIHLRIYKDNVLHSARIISYDEIKGGKEYLIKKDVTGEVDIVAWAVPANTEFVADIPTPAEDESMTGELLKMKPSSRNGGHESLGQLYLGTFTYYETAITSDTNAKISMNSCIAQFSATIHNVPDFYNPGEEDPAWLIIHGTKSQMDPQFTPQGEDALVAVDLMKTEENSNILKTGTHGLLPSDEGQFISVEAYRKDTHYITLNTNIQAQPGDIIHVDIYTKSITIYVNGWRVFETSADWI